jgi:transposase-like protein
MLARYAAAAAVTSLVADAFPERLAKGLEQLGTGARLSDEAAQAFLNAAWRGETPADLVSPILSDQINEDVALQAAIGRIGTNLSDFLADAVLVLMPRGDAPLRVSLADRRIEIFEEAISGFSIQRSITEDLAAIVVLPDSAAFAGPPSSRRRPSVTIDPERKWDRLRGLIVLAAAAVLVSSAGTLAVENVQFLHGIEAANSALAIGAIAADKAMHRRRRGSGEQRAESASVQDLRRQPWQVKLDTAERLMKGESAINLAAEIGVSSSSVRRWRKLAHEGGQCRLHLKESLRSGSDEDDYFTQRRVEAQISAVELILQGDESLPNVADRLLTSVSNVQLWVEEYRIGSRRALRKIPDIIENFPLPPSPWEPPERLHERQLRQCLEGHGFLGVRVLLIEIENGCRCVLQFDRPSETALDEALDADWHRDGLPMAGVAAQCLGRELTLEDWHLASIISPTVISASDVVRLYIVLYDQNGSGK